MGMMIIRHKVRDYGQWRPIFDGHVELQKAAGLFNPRVYHSADSNKSEIVVVFDTEDTKKAKDFAASADLKEAMIKAGVLDTPTIYFLESIDCAKSPTMSARHPACLHRGCTKCPRASASMYASRSRWMPSSSEASPHLPI